MKVMHQWNAASKWWWLHHNTGQLILNTLKFGEARICITRQKWRILPLAPLPSGITSCFLYVQLPQLQDSGIVWKCISLMWPFPANTHMPDGLLVSWTAWTIYFIGHCMAVAPVNLWPLQGYLCYRSMINLFESLQLYESTLLIPYWDLICKTSKLWKQSQSEEYMEQIEWQWKVFSKPV